MKVSDLNNEQIQELKVRYFREQYGEEPSMGEIMEIDDIVSDSEILGEFADCEFSEDDFFCSAEVEE